MKLTDKKRVNRKQTPDEIINDIQNCNKLVQIIVDNNDRQNVTKFKCQTRFCRKCHIRNITRMLNKYQEAIRNYPSNTQLKWRMLTLTNEPVSIEEIKEETQRLKNCFLLFRNILGIPGGIWGFHYLFSADLLNVYIHIHINIYSEYIDNRNERYLSEVWKILNKGCFADIRLIHEEDILKTMSYLLRYGRVKKDDRDSRIDLITAYQRANTEQKKFLIKSFSNQKLNSKFGFMQRTKVKKITKRTSTITGKEVKPGKRVSFIIKEVTGEIPNSDIKYQDIYITESIPDLKEYLNKSVLQAFLSWNLLEKCRNANHIEKCKMINGFYRKITGNPIHIKLIPNTKKTEKAA